MSLKINELEDFIKSVNYPVLISVSDCEAWCLSEDEDEIRWVSLCKDNGLEGYSCYLPEGFVRQGGYFVGNLDTQTGCWQTEIFEESKELSEDDFYDKYEECM